MSWHVLQSEFGLCAVLNEVLIFFMLVDSTEYASSCSVNAQISQVANLPVHDCVAHADAQSNHCKDPFAFLGIGMPPFVLLIVQRIFGSIKSCEIPRHGVNATKLLARVVFLPS